MRAPCCTDGKSTMWLLYIHWYKPVLVHVCALCVCPSSSSSLLAVCAVLIDMAELDNLGVKDESVP